MSKIKSGVKIMSGVKDCRVMSRIRSDVKDKE